MFTLGALGSMVANFAMGGSFIFELFILSWFVNGYFQSMGYPSSLKLVANWFNKNQQGKAVGMSECLQSAASVLILPLAGWLAFTIHWRLVFFVPAVLIGMMSIMFWVLARDNPQGVKPEKKTKPLLKDMGESYRKALGDWRLVTADISYGCCQFVRYAMITWIPAYLYFETQANIFEAAIIAMTFQIGGIFGSLIMGWLADTKTFCDRRWIMICVGMVISGIAGAAVGIVDVSFAWGIIGVLMVCGAGIEALEVCYFLTPTDYLGKELTATGVGCMNAVGKAMATVQGVLLGAIIDSFGYGSAFGVAGAFGLVAAVLIIPSRRLKNNA